MAQAKFSAGQRVAVARSGGYGAPARMFRIVSALPRDAGPQQYRVRSETENFERVVDEALLEAASYE